MPLASCLGRVEGSYTRPLGQKRREGGGKGVGGLSRACRAYAGSFADMKENKKGSQKHDIENSCKKTCEAMRFKVAPRLSPGVPTTAEKEKQRRRILFEMVPTSVCRQTRKTNFHEEGWTSSALPSSEK
jgi:hypothetical protein